MIKDTWVTTNKYMDEQIMNQLLLRNKTYREGTIKAYFFSY